MKKYLLLLALSLFWALPALAGTTWVNNPLNCDTSKAPVVCNNPPNTNGRICGLNALGGGLCIGDASTILPPAFTTLSQSQYSGSFNGGYLLDCEANDGGGTQPFCDNSGNLWCNLDATCSATHHQTICAANKWAGASGAFSCGSSAQCMSGWVSCAGVGSNNCDTQIGVTTCTIGGTPGTYDGTCTCVPLPKQYFQTGTQAQYGSTDPLLWGEEFGTGDLINISNTTTIFRVSSTGTVSVNGVPIGNSQWTTTSTGIFYNGGNVGIGTNSPSQQVELTGNLKLPVNSDGLEGIVYSGASTLINTYGVHNTFIGQNAGNLTLTIGAGGEDTAIGYDTLQSETTGGINVAIGAYASQFNTGGDGNNAIGYKALRYNQNGVDNIAIGSHSLENVIGDYNTAIGFQAGYSLVTSSNNMFLGFNAGVNQISGDNNICIGKQTDVPSSTGSNQMNIGNTIYGDTNLKRVFIGTTTLATPFSFGVEAVGSDGPFVVATSTGGVALMIDSSGNVGIDKTSPNTALDVKGTITQSAVKSCSYGLTTNSSGSITGCASAGTSQWTTTNTTDIYYNTGNVGIGTSTPGYPLSVVGNINTTGNYLINGTDAFANSSTWAKALEWNGGASDLVAATGRTSLGLGTMATQNTADYMTTGTLATTYSPLAGSASLTTVGTINSGSWAAGVIPIAYGGTETSTAPSLGQILAGNARGTYNYLAAGTNGYFLAASSTNASGLAWTAQPWRWSVNILNATTTDTSLLIGGCTDKAITVTKVTTLIASSTWASGGIAFNIYASTTQGGAGYQTLLSTVANPTTNAIATYSAFTSSTLPADTCFWYYPTAASSTQVPNLLIKIYGTYN